MRILKNVAGQELACYTSQPTARMMNERIMKDSVATKGDKSAETAFAVRYNVEKAANQADTVEISLAGQKLSQTENAKGIAKAQENVHNIEFHTVRRGDNRISVFFDSSAMVHRAVEQGYIEMEGKRLELPDPVKKQLLFTNKQIQNAKNAVFMHNTLLHDAANARQSSDAMKKAGAKMSRVMNTALRIMHGKKVSSEDVKELMESDPELYSMAQISAALAKQRHKKDDKEDEKISAENDEARAREKEPKDYSVEETPMPQIEVQMDVSFDGDVPQVTAVGAGVPSE